ncbi:MAG: hypothetical protein OEY85_06900, partial [Rhodospirillales bacterium]|nr:hypothetical protein [Rhodospirillales bacterium]
MNEQDPQTTQEEPAPQAEHHHHHHHPHDQHLPHHATLGVISFGLAAGLTYGLFILLIGLSATFFEWGLAPVSVLSHLYVGYSPTLIGSIAGTVWAFVNGFIA